MTFYTDKCGDYMVSVVFDSHFPMETWLERMKKAIHYYFSSYVKLYNALFAMNTNNNLFSNQIVGLKQNQSKIGWLTQNQY